ncbi:MAG TPA: arginine repressor [Gemmatimonadaceae bacterium]|nr:arginine repressor [Gemmatimonadaceae bacterium]
MANKRERQATILELIRAQPIGSQEELRELLEARGLDVTQSTLSRDIHELRLARVPTADGVRYGRADGERTTDDTPTLEALVPQLLTRIDGVSELLVLHTPPGGAQPIAFALDHAPNPDILGTIAGDDTILIICRSIEARTRLDTRLRRLAKKG